MSTVDQAAHIQLKLSSRAENVAVVRQALTGLADATGMSLADLNDVSTAVTEACNNAAMHAYGADEGPLEVELFARDATMVVTVRDHGVGLRLDDGAPAEFPTDVDGELAGIGVPSIKALARTARWSEPAGGGTEVEMTFSTPLPAWAGSVCGDGDRAPFASKGDPLPDAIEVAIAPAQVARSVLPRLLRVMASRAHFSVERHANVQRIAAVVLDADASDWVSWGVQARLAAGSGSLDVRTGAMSERDVAELVVAVRAIEPKLDTSTERLNDGSQRLLLRL